MEADPEWAAGYRKCPVEDAVGLLKEKGKVKLRGMITK
jgi:hypothetical protein